MCSSYPVFELAGGNCIDFTNLTQVKVAVLTFTFNVIDK